jgi:uncharacterized protein (TIGR00369 family)
MDERTYGVADPATRSSEDGLTFLLGMLNGQRPHPPICRTLGFHLAEVSEGQAVFEGMPRIEHYNPIGTVHAGFAATLLDSALACAIWSTVGREEAWTTLEIKLNFVRPMTHETGTVRADAKVLHRGATMATSQADLKDLRGHLIAHGTTTCMIIPPKA